MFPQTMARLATAEALSLIRGIMSAVRGGLPYAASKEFYSFLTETKISGIAAVKTPAPVKPTSPRPVNINHTLLGRSKKEEGPMSKVNTA